MFKGKVAQDYAFGIKILDDRYACTRFSHLGEDL
jgi:hypothetical protein